MKKTLILDFMGVIADVDYVKIAMSFPLKQRFSALRIFLSLKKNPKIKAHFKQYQMGTINLEEFQKAIGEIYPNSAYIVPLLLQKFKENVKINTKVLSLIKYIKSYDVQVLLMSNTIPETESIIMESEIPEIFDGLMCSTELGLLKPYGNIYGHALVTYDIFNKQTLMIDDSPKNLEKAEMFGFKTLRCKSSKETIVALKKYLAKLSEVFIMEDSDVIV